LTFEEWLTHQQKREDDIGFLARFLVSYEVQPKASNRKPDEHKYWVDIVTKIEGPGYIYNFNIAWQEYLHARQAAKDHPG
jgi:hypothetical protein